MLIRWIALCFALGLWAGVSVAAAQSVFAEKLATADSIRSTDPKQFEKLLEELQTGVAQATPVQRELLQYLLAYQLAYRSKYQEAIQAATTLFEQGTDLSVRFRAGLLATNSLAGIRDFASGLRQLDQTLKLGEQVTDKELLHNGLTVAAVLYNQLGQFELGQHYAEKILADQPNPRTRCFAGHLRLESLQNLSALPKNTADIESVIADCSAQNEILATNLSRGYLARQYASSGAHADAIELLQTHLQEVEATRYPRLIAEFNSLLAQSLLITGKTDSASQHAQTALTNAPGNSPPRIAALYTLYEAALRRADAAQALDFFRQYAEADKGFLDDVKARELAFQLAKHETLQKTQTIELLNKQNLVLQLEQKVATQSARFNQLLIGVLVVLLFGIAYWAYKVKRVQNVFRHLAQIDALTGVNNRHYFHLQAEAALQKCAENRLAAVLIMFDLDHFKMVNDTYGHATGDWVLRKVADTAKALCRDRDYIGRLGGEEFAILLIAAEIESGMALAEQCRALIADIDTRPSGHEFAVAASFGVATTRVAGYEFRILLAQADKAVYRSKHDGRNQVNAFDHSEPDNALASPRAQRESLRHPFTA